MKNQEAFKSGNLISDNDSLLSDCNIDAGNSVDNDTSLREELLLEEMESYWDDLNSRLTVSRMVSDSVIKGIVNAIELEASEKVDTKEAEISALKKRLQFYESVMADENRIDATSTKMLESQREKSGLFFHSLDQDVVSNCVQHLSQLKVAAQDYLKRPKKETSNLRGGHPLLKAKVCPVDKEFCSILAQKLNVIDGSADELEAVLMATQQEIYDTCFSSEYLVNEQLWEHRFQQEVISIMVQNLVREDQDDIEAKISKQKILVDTFTKNWQKNINDLSTMHQELHDISASLLTSESGLAFSRHSPEDAVKLTTADTSHLNHMTKAELITNYITQMANMKRQYDLALQEKTEELYILKREFLKEKGCNALQYRRDKEGELLRKKIIGFISMLDNILLENEKLSVVQSQQNMLHNLSQRIGVLLLENQQLKYLLVEKRMEVIHVAALVSNVINRSANCSEVEEDLLEHHKEFKSDAEDRITETMIRDKIEKILLRELVDELEIGIKYLDLECKMSQDISFTLCREYLEDVVSSINSFVEKHYREKDSFATLVVEKEMALSLLMEENEKLKQEKDLLLTLINEKEKLLFETEVKAMKQKEYHDNVCHELNMLREQLGNQSLHISDCKKDNDSMKEKLAEMLKQVPQYEAELRKINQKYKVALDSLEKLEKQKNFLHELVEEKQMKLELAVAREEEHSKFMTTVLSSIKELSETILQSECSLTNKLGTHESRLEFLGHQFIGLFQQANYLKREVCWYKQGFERRCADLQKAEHEVDLLGDEVDVLLHLLEKIHVALEHYSPVLQHYPGVVEILRLIKREIKSNTI
ncbi:unnamed protein product [Musa acuminata subsp. malaccensis]|uniref:(wild Malaysian banana) hypothetical protein n=1 Tax=Musa acuminata subsp. malaccensis TaxID=214687 RepID=A0A804JIM5_MUSAM|nr:PREDICTED: WPP domain-associated protein-like [Musa acuminata subsp. malaccensis]CAG1846906.1 unnamed protein product [Musa acuminata subsp. malaccensis]